MCFGCSKEPSHGDGSFEYPQNMFWLRNKENNFQLHTLMWWPEIEKRMNILLFGLLLNVPVNSYNGHVQTVMLT